MQRAYSTLTITKAAESGGDSRIIEGIASTPSTDRMGDIVDPMGAEFKTPMPFLWQHNADKPMGWVEWAKPTKEGIPFRAKIAPKGLLPWIDEAWTMIQAGLVRAVSIGFRSLESADIKGTWGVHFTKWEWLELSAVTIPANADATITTIKKFDDAALAQRAAATGTERATAGAAMKLPGASGKSSIKLQGTTAMKTIQEQIASFEAKRHASAERMSAIMAKSAEEGRTLSEDEVSEYDSLNSEVKAVDEHLVRLRAHERSVVSKAAPITPEAGTDSSVAMQVRGGGVISVSSNAPKGTAFTRYAMLLAASKGNLVQAAEMSKQFKDMPQLETIFKAAVAAGTTTDASWAAPLLPYNDMASEFIELLRPATVIGRTTGFRRVPFNIRMPRQTAGASAGWVGQGAPKPVSALSFDTVSLPWSKIAVIIALTEELVRFSNPSAEALCRQDMIDTIATFMDQQFLDPDVAISANVSPASITNGVTPTPSTGSTVAAIMTDVSTLFQRFNSINLTPRAGVWYMNPRTALYLSMLRTAQDVYAFPGITMTGGTFFGLPVITSNSVSLDQGSPSASYIVLADAAEILLADDGGVTLDVSREASLQMDSAPAGGAAQLVSLWQNNLVGLRAERYVTWLKRRSGCVVWMDGVTY